MIQKMDGSQTNKKKIMPEIILKKEIKRTFGEFEKVFPVGSKYFVNWDGYLQMVKDEICDEIAAKIPKKTKAKKVIKTKKEI